MMGPWTAIVGTLVFTAMAGINYRIGRSWLYPAAGLTAVWAVVFLVLCVAEAWLYPVPWSALGIYVVGASYFSLGAYCGLGVPLRRAASSGYRARRSDHQLLLFLLLVLIGGFPLYLKEIMSLTSAPLLTPLFFLQLRQALLEQGATMSRAPLVDNLVVLSSIAALVGMAASDGMRHWRPLVGALVSIGFIYNLLTASKAGLVSLIVALVVIYILKRGMPSKRFLLSTAMLFFFGFGAISVSRIEAQTGSGLSFWAAVQATGEAFINYFTVAVVGFGVYLQHPDKVPAVWSIWRFFKQTANYFVPYFPIPSRNAAYVAVGPGMNYNVYTAYFAYYPTYGVLGVSAIMSALGLAGTVIYRKAKQGGIIPVVVYGVVFYGYCVTVFSESLFMALNYLVKVLVACVVFQLARRIKVTSTPTSKSRRIVPSVGGAHGLR